MSVQSSSAFLDCAPIPRSRDPTDLTYTEVMCRNIRNLYNFEPTTTHEEVHDAALQYVRKVSGMAKPSRVNEEAFARAVEAVAHVTEHLLAELVTTAPPRDREVDAERRRARFTARQGRLQSVPR